MDLPINAKHINQLNSLKEYIKSINESFIERKSQTYSYDFKKDHPMILLNSEENFQEYSKVNSGVNYVWEKVDHNLIGKKTRKSSEFPLKKKLHNILHDQNRVSNNFILANGNDQNYTYISDEKSMNVISQKFFRDEK